MELFLIVISFLIWICFKWIKKSFALNDVIIDNSQIMYFIEQEGYRDKSSEKTLSDLENEIK